METPQAPQVNPYGAPLARVEDAAAGSAGILDRARSVPAGHALAWYSEAWRLFKLSPGAWIGIWLIFFVILVAISAIPFIGGLISALLTPVFVGGVMLAARDADRNGDVAVGKLFAAFSTHAGPLVLVGLLQLALWVVFFLIASVVIGVYIGIGVGAGMSFESFMSPGVLLPIILIGFILGILYIPFTMAVWLAATLVALHDIGALDALRMGFSAAFRNLLALIVLVLVTIPLAVVASVPFLLGWFVLGPVLLILLYAEYRDLFALTESSPPRA